MTNHELAQAFVHNKPWVEAISNGKVIWAGERGWNLYYCISGSQYCDWHLFLYNDECKKCYYQNAYVSGSSSGITLFVIHKLSSNVYLLDLFANETGGFVAHQPEREMSVCKEVMYVCEPPDIETFDPTKAFDVNNRYFNCKPISCKEEETFKEEEAINNHDQLVLLVKNKKNTSSLLWEDKRSHCCRHPNKKIINYVIIHPTLNKFRFVIDDAKQTKCALCLSKSYFLKIHDVEPKLVIFYNMMSSFLLNY